MYRHADVLFVALTTGAAATVRSAVAAHLSGPEPTVEVKSIQSAPPPEGSDRPEFVAKAIDSAKGGC